MKILSTIKRLIGKLNYRLFYNDITSGDLDEIKRLEEQSEVIIQQAFNRQKLLEDHKDKFHYKINLTSK